MANPTTVNEVLEDLLPKFEGMEDYLGKGVSEDGFASFCHSQLSGGIGMHIRNMYGLWDRDSELYQHLAGIYGETHPDNLSDKLIRAVYQKLILTVDMEKEPEEKLLFRLTPY